MLPSNRCLAAVGLLLLSAAAVGTASAQERLRWKFKKGETTNYQIVQAMDMKMSVMGQNIDSKMNQTMDLGWTVDSVASDGTATLRQKITRVQMKMTVPPFLNVQYDSAAEEQPDDPVGGQLAKAFEAIVGEEFTMQMTPRGEIRKVEVPDALAAALEGAGGGGAFPGGAGFNEDTLKQLVSQSSIAFPQEPVSQGHKWQSGTEATLPFGTMKIDNQFTALGTEQRGGKSLHKIGVKPRMTLEADPNAQIQMTVKSQDANGTIYFDSRAGRIAESTMKQKMEMDLSANGQAIAQTLDQTMTMKLVPNE
jgi:Family of unknown function (DUF6263)